MSAKYCEKSEIRVNTDNISDNTNDNENHTHYTPSHNMTGKYVVLMETNDKECESWYYFLRIEGNEEALKDLKEQLSKIRWYVLDDLSIFDLDLDNPVDAIVAKQMTKIEINRHSYHRKFDGKLKKIDFSFSKKDLKDNTRMMCKVFDILGYGQIEYYIDDEDIDQEDLFTEYSGSDDSESESSDDSKSDNSESNNSHSEHSDDSESEHSDDSDSDDSYESNSESKSESSSEETDAKKKYTPKNPIPIPSWARSKRRYKNRH